MLSNIRVLIEKIYEINTKNGFHKQRRTWSTVMNLIHSEISECVEAVRDSEHKITEIWYQASGKPDGLPIELADVSIRCLDTAKEYGREEELIENYIRLAPILPKHSSILSNVNDRPDDYMDALYEMHRSIDDIDVPEQLRFLGDTVIVVEMACAKLGHKLEDLIEIKLAYNTMRGYLHGKLL